MFVISNGISKVQKIHIQSYNFQEIYVPNV